MANTCLGDDGEGFAVVVVDGKHVALLCVFLHYFCHGMVNLQ